MHHEAEPRGHLQAYLLIRQPCLAQLRHLAAQGFLVALAGEAVGTVYDIAHEVDAPAVNREHLIVPLHVEQPVVVQVVVDIHQDTVKERLAAGQHDHVVGIAVIIPHTGELFKPVVKFRQVQVGEMLGDVIADGYAIGGVDDAVEQPQHVGVFDFLPHDHFQCVVVDARIELAHIQFEAVACSFRVVPEVFAQFPQQGMDAAPLDTGIGVGGESRSPERFEYLHYRPLRHSVAVGQLVDFAPFGFILDEYGVF